MYILGGREPCQDCHLGSAPSQACMRGVPTFDPRVWIKPPVSPTVTTRRPVTPTVTRNAAPCGALSDGNRYTYPTKLDAGLRRPGRAVVPCPVPDARARKPIHLSTCPMTSRSTSRP